MTSPTTPRDAIAGLSERLREEVARLSYRSLNHGCATCGCATNLADEAATQLDALSAENVRLREQYTELLTERHIIFTNGKEWRNRATSAEQQRDEAYERAAKVADARSARHQQVYNKLAEALECSAIAAAIRRLASGPDKEKSRES